MKRFLCKSVSGRFALGTTVIRSPPQFSFFVSDSTHPSSFDSAATTTAMVSRLSSGGCRCCAVRSELEDGIFLSCVYGLDSRLWEIWYVDSSPAKGFSFAA